MIRRILILSAAALLLAGAAAAGDDESSSFTWTSDDGGAFVVASGGAFLGDDVERTEFDLAELRDGESRTIATERGEIVATREGDVVELSGPGLGGDRIRRIGPMSCDIGSGECKLAILSLDSGRQAVMLESGRTCEGDDCPHAVSFHHATACAGDDCDVAVARDVTICTSDGEDDAETDCRSIVIDTLGGGHVLDLDAIEGAEDGHVVIRRAVAGGMPHIVVAGGDRLTLRCPEGDTTMTVKKDRADEVFLCPEHSVPLEKAKNRFHSFSVTVDEEADGASEY